MPVEFDEQEFNQPRTMGRDESGAVTNLVLKLGLAKNASQANIVMLIVAIVAIGLAVFLMFPDRATAPTPAVIDQPSAY